MIRSLLSAGLVLALTVVAGVVHAQDGDVEAARANFNRGVELYGQSDYQGALASFQEAYRIRPHPAVRVNMANCYDHLSRPVEAIFHFEHYLTEMGRNAPAPQRREVEQALVSLRQRVGRVALHIAPDGATVRIDDAEERRSPVLEDVVLTAGSHRVVVSLNGFRTETRTVEVAGGREVNLDVRLERGADPTIAQPVNPQPTFNPQQDPGQQASTQQQPTAEPVVVEGAGGDTSSGGGLHLTTPTIVVASVSAGAIVIACITGALASGANSDFDRDVARANDPSLSDADRNAAIRQGRDDASRANSLATVTDVLGIAGALGLGVAVTMFFLSGSEDHPDTQARVVAAPMLSHDTAGIAVRGSF